MLMRILLYFVGIDGIYHRESKYKDIFILGWLSKYGYMYKEYSIDLVYLNIEETIYFEYIPEGKELPIRVLYMNCTGFRIDSYMNGNTFIKEKVDMNNYLKVIHKSKYNVVLRGIIYLLQI